MKADELAHASLELARGDSGLNSQVCVCACLYVCVKERQVVFVCVRESETVCVCECV